MKINLWDLLINSSYSTILSNDFLNYIREKFPYVLPIKISIKISNLKAINYWCEINIQYNYTVIVGDKIHYYYFENKEDYIIFKNFLNIDNLDVYLKLLYNE